MTGFKILFSKSYLFNVLPSGKFSYFIPMTIFFAILILLATAIVFFAQGDLKKLTYRYIAPFYTTGALGFIHLITRFEQLPWFSARFFLLLVGLIFLVWMSVLIIWSARYTPKYLKEKAVEDRYRKYLPQEKRRRDGMTEGQKQK